MGRVYTIIIRVGAGAVRMWGGDACIAHGGRTLPSTWAMQASPPQRVIRGNFEHKPGMGINMPQKLFLYVVV